MNGKNLERLQEVWRKVFRKMSQEWIRNVEKGISGSQAIILENLELQGPQKATELAEVLCITSGAVTGLCDKLIAGGYATRRRSEEDRRNVYMEITAKGSETLAKVRQLRKDIIKKFFSGLSDSDIEHLIRIYNQILINMESQGE